VSRRTWTLVLALAIAACAPTTPRPFVPALREEAGSRPRSPTEDAPFRRFPPDPMAPESFPHVAVASLTLDSGLRVLLVERHGYPVIAAQLRVDTEAANAGDAGGWRAHLLGSVFLSPPSGVVQTSGGCSAEGCWVTSRGTRDELAEVLGRVADLVCGESARPEEYERRLTFAATTLEKGGGQGSAQIERSARALLFGLGELYGEPRATPPRPTLDDLRSLRARAFVPGASTLVLAGDIERDAAVAEIKKRFGGWVKSPGPAPGPPAAPPLSRDARRLLLIQNRAVTQTLGAIVARGPVPREDDSLAFALLAQTVGGGMSSAAYRHVREELGAAYSVGARVETLPGASMFVLNANFERGKAIEGMNALVEIVRNARDGELSVETLERGKRALIAGWRRSLSTDAGVASLLDQTVSCGMPAEGVDDFPARARALTAAQVRAVAQRYLAPSQLRALLVGQPEDLAGIDAPMFGAASLADGFGRPVAAAHR
jgi:zinc protease